MKFADLLTLGFVLSCVLPLASTASAGILRGKIGTIQSVLVEGYSRKSNLLLESSPSSSPLIR